MMLFRSYVDAAQLEISQIGELRDLLAQFGFTMYHQPQNPVFSERYNLMATGPTVNLTRLESAKDVTPEHRKLTKLALQPADFKTLQTMLGDAPEAVAVVDDAQLREKLVQQGYAYKAPPELDQSKFRKHLRQILANPRALILGDRLLREVQNEAMSCEICSERTAFGLLCDCGKVFHWWCADSDACSMCGKRWDAQSE